MRDVVDRGGEEDLPDEQQNDDQAEDVHPIRRSERCLLERTASCSGSETLSRRFVDWEGGEADNLLVECSSRTRNNVWTASRAVTTRKMIALTFRRVLERLMSLGFELDM